MDLTKPAALVKALVEIKVVGLNFHLQMYFLGSFTSDTYFTSVKTRASTVVVTIAATIIISKSTSSTKHSVILLESTCKAHVADLASDTPRTL